MSKFTIIYSDFSARVNEVTLLRKKAAKLERSKDALLHGPEISALCRASVVLLSSHIEAYIKELGEHTLDCAHKQLVPRDNIAPQFFYYISRERIEGIRSSSNPDSIANHVQSLFDTDGQFWQGNGPLHGPILSSSFNYGFSNPRFEKVKTYFNRFGYSNFYKDFMRKIGRRGSLVESSLNSIVDTRNSIAHGDPLATKTPAEVREMELSAREFCRTVDSIFAKWCRLNLCKIR